MGTTIAILRKVAMNVEMGEITQSSLMRKQISLGTREPAPYSFRQESGATFARSRCGAIDARHLLVGGVFYLGYLVFVILLVSGALG